MKLTILEAMIKGYQGALSLSVSVKRRDRGPGLRVTEDGLVELA